MPQVIRTWNIQSIIYNVKQSLFKINKMYVMKQNEFLSITMNTYIIGQKVKILFSIPLAPYIQC